MEYILTSVKDHAGTITFNRPEAHNAMNYDLLAQFEKAIEDFEKDANVYAVVLTGAGKSFMAGADLAFCRDLDVLQTKHWCNNMNRIFAKVENSAKPYIAAINGHALGGGCELALCCDLRYVSEKAKIGLTEVKVGITPGAGGTQRLPRLVGVSKAKELIYTGRPVGAQEALDIGLVNGVSAPEELLADVMQIANAIIGNGQFAVRQAKLEINRGLQCDIQTAIAFETESCVLCFATEDRREGMSAFVEKRQPKFTDYRV